jgi:hypothetical protein
MVGPYHYWIGADAYHDPKLTTPELGVGFTSESDHSAWNVR